ncbi:MAG TPA: two-component regulator propeller domain-containing protein [archaeon]|nr:two-component regulator propeller domain-containing protein [archaeon]
MKGRLIISVFSMLSMFFFLGSAKATFINYTNANAVYDLAMEGDYILWAVSYGGVVRWNLKDGSYKKYTTLDGLADNCVNAIAIDQQGNKWFGTTAGVTKFDGTTWTTYTTDYGSATYYLYDIVIDTKGDLWCLGGVLNRFDGTNWTSYPDVGFATLFVMDHLGNLWFGTEKTMSKFDGTTWTTYTTEDGLANNSFCALAIDAEGNLWCATLGEGVCRFDGTTWTTYTTEDGLADNVVLAIAADLEGNLWFGTEGGGVSRFDGSEWITYTTENGLACNNVSSIVIDSLGNKWFAFAYYGEGVSRFDGSNWTTFTKSDGLTDNLVNFINVDAYGDIWCTGNKGINRFNGSTWQTYTTDDNGPSIGIRAIVQDSEGEMWFATVDGVYRFDGINWTNYTTDDGLAFNIVRGITIDSKGDKWFATSGGGVSRFDGSTWTTYTTADGLGHNDIKRIAKDSKDNIWCGSRGISRFDGTSWTHYMYPIFDGGSCFGLGIDQEDNVWCGTWDGVAVFDGINWTATYTTADGLSSDHVRVLAIDPDGNKWFGYEYDGDGVTKFDGTNWTTYTTADGLANNIVYAIAFDSKGNAWFGTMGGGVSKFDGTTWTTYTTADGLASNFVRSIGLDAQGNIWFGTDGGVSVLAVSCVNIDPVLFNEYVAYGLDDFWLKENGSISGGNAGSNDGADIGVKAEVDGNVSSGGDLKLKQNATVDGDANVGGELTLGPKAEITGTVTYGPVTPLTFSVAAFSAGGQSFDIKKKETLNLQPGTYDVLKMKQNSELTLHSGSYFFNSIDIGTKVNIHLDLSGGPLYVYVVGQLEVSENSKVDILPATGDASQVFWVILGEQPNGNTGTSFIGVKVEFIGTVIAPNSKLWAKENSKIQGALYGKELIVGVKSELAFARTGPAAVPTLLAGAASLAGVAEAAGLPRVFSLSQNSPNPFNPSTTISYSIPEGILTPVSLKVYDLRGKLARTLIQGARPAGVYSVYWDGTDEAGRQLSSGVYFYRLQAGEFTQTRKMVLLK